MLSEFYVSEIVSEEDSERGPFAVIMSNSTDGVVMDVYGDDAEAAKWTAEDMLTKFAIVDWLEDQLRQSPNRLVAVADAMRDGATMIEAIRKNN